MEDVWTALRSEAMQTDKEENNKRITERMKLPILVYLRCFNRLNYPVRLFRNPLLCNSLAKSKRKSYYGPGRAETRHLGVQARTMKIGQVLGYGNGYEARLVQ